MNTKYINYSWAEYTLNENVLFEYYNFTGTIFENTSFEKVTFKNCLFYKCDTNHIGLWNCNFINCEFKDVDLRNVPIGADGGILKKCQFIRCDFRGQHFWFPVFEDCIFEKCKLKNINFNDASFLKCKFIGKLEDVTFNGMYHKIKKEIKPLDYVDFSESIFGDYVGFEDCDLSTCIPPVGKTFNELLYIADLNDLKHLSTGSKDRYVIPKKENTDLKR